LKLRNYSADLAETEEAIDKETFSGIIHCAAKCNVNDVTSDPNIAYLVNVESTNLLAQIAKRKNIHFTFISTNYVFDGQKGAPYNTDDPTNPINDYGKQKAEAELKVLASNPSAAILRISLQYGRHGRRFLWDVPTFVPQIWEYGNFLVRKLIFTL